MKTRERIRTIRISRGMTQAKLADLLHVSHSYQCRIEKGTSTISLDYIQSAAAVLQVTPQDILRDIFVYPEDSPPSEQVRLLVEFLPEDEQLIMLDLVKKLAARQRPSG